MWHIALKSYGGPFLHGKVADPARRKMMEAALKAARAAGYIVSPVEDDVEILNMATATSFDAFERKVRICREEIYLAVRHAYTPFMQSNSGAGESRGDTGVSKHSGADPVEYMLAKAVGRCLTVQLAPDLVIPNFPAGTGVPRIVLGGVNWAETKTQIEVAALIAEKFKVWPSVDWLYEISQVSPAKGPGDTPPAAMQPATPPPVPGGAPGGIGTPPVVPPGQGGGTPVPGSSPPPRLRRQPPAAPARCGLRSQAQNKVRAEGNSRRRPGAMGPSALRRRHHRPAHDQWRGKVVPPERDRPSQGEVGARAARAER